MNTHHTVIRRRNGVVIEHTIDGIPQSIDGMPVLPSPFTMARNAFGAALAAAKNPTRVSNEEKARRLAICQGCEFLIRKSGKSFACVKCGCILKWKTALETWHCPIGKW